MKMQYLFLTSSLHFGFSKPQWWDLWFLLWNQNSENVTDEGEGVGDMRASTGCEVVVDCTDRREACLSNLHYFAEFVHR